MLTVRSGSIYKLGIMPAFRVNHVIKLPTIIPVIPVMNVMRGITVITEVAVLIVMLPGSLEENKLP